MIHNLKHPWQTYQYLCWTASDCKLVLALFKLIKGYKATIDMPVTIVMCDP